MRFFHSKLLLCLLGIVTLTPSCSRSSSANANLAALAAVITYTKLLGQYTLAPTASYPKSLDSMTLTHTGSQGQVEFSFADPSGAVGANPATGTLQPGESRVIQFDSLGFTHLQAVMTMTVVYATVLGSADSLVVPFQFLLNGGNLPALATIMAITAPTVLRHLLTPQFGYPRNIERITLKHTASSGPAVDYELSSPGPIGTSKARGTLQPGEELTLDIFATQSQFTLAALTLVMSYAIIASTDRLERSYEFRNASPPGLAALAVIQLITGNSNLVPGLFWPGLLLALVLVAVLHSKRTVPSRIPLLLYTEIALVGVMTFVLTLAMLQASFWRSKSSPNQSDAVHFPPGAGPNGYTIHPDSEVDMKAGDYHFFHMTMAAPIPITDPEPKNQHVYSFVMESDGQPANDWIGFPDFPNDFFLGADSWYQITYNAAGQHKWKLSVTKVLSGGRSTNTVTSAARAIIKDDAVVLVVPASEFALKKPSWRATSFVHQGDFGINPPHTWSGDLMPPVKDGLNLMR